LSSRSTGGGEPAAKGDGGDAIDEGATPVELEHRNPFAIGPFELGVAGDVDLLVRDALRPERRSSRLAEVAAVRGVEDDPRRYG
jgi:hypothetical protein